VNGNCAAAGHGPPKPAMHKLRNDTAFILALAAGAANAPAGTGPPVADAP
jgi:hypothetical protein